MPKGAKSKGIGKRNTGGGKSKKKAHKQAVRSGFETRHIDQVWEDVRKQVNVVTKPDGTRLGPVGTTTAIELDADLPGQGKNYCVACSRYFTSPIVLADHERSKPHKRRVKALKGAKPHNQGDADLAGDMGKPDNGLRLRPEGPSAMEIADVMEGLQHRQKAMMTVPLFMPSLNTFVIAAQYRSWLGIQRGKASSRPCQVVSAQFQGDQATAREKHSSIAPRHLDEQAQVEQLEKGLGVDQASAGRSLSSWREPADAATSSARTDAFVAAEDTGSEQGTTPLAKQQPGEGTPSTQGLHQANPLQDSKGGRPPIKRLTRQKDTALVPEADMGEQRVQPKLDGMLGVDALPKQPVKDRLVSEQPVIEEQTSLKRPSGAQTAVEDGKRVASLTGTGGGKLSSSAPQVGSGRPVGKQRTGKGFGKAKEASQDERKRSGKRSSSTAKLKQQPVASQGSLMDKLQLLAAEGKVEDFVHMARSMIPVDKRPTAFSQLLQMVAGKQSLATAITICCTLDPDRCRYWKELLHLFIERKNKQAVERIITAMLDNEAVMAECKVLAFIEAFKACARLGLAVTADELYEARLSRKEERPNIYVCNALLNAMASDCTLAFERFQELLDEGLEPSVVTFNTLLKACMLAHDAKPANEVLQQLQQRGLKGDEYTFNTLIKIFSYSGDAPQTLQVKGLMEEARFELTPSVWGSLLVVCGQAGFLEQAFGFWTEMKALGVPITADCASALMRACSLAYQGERAIDLLHEMKFSGLQPDLVTYNIAIKACDAPPGILLSKTQLDIAFGLLADMKAAGVEPDAVTYTALFTLCAHAKSGRRALAASEEMTTAGIKSDVKSCTALIAALGSEGLMDEALTVFHKMVWGPRRMKPTQVTFRLVTRMCREHGRLEKALQVYQGMRQMGFAPSNAEFRELTGACAEQAIKEGHGSSLAKKMVEILKLEQRYEVDLHGLSEAEARAMVLCSLLSLQSSYKEGQPIESDLVIITGVGHHSDADEGPKLREAVLRLLSQELHLLPEGASTVRQPSERRQAGVTSLAMEYDKEAIQPEVPTSTSLTKGTKPLGAKAQDGEEGNAGSAGDRRGREAISNAQEPTLPPEGVVASLVEEQPGESDELGKGSTKFPAEAGQNRNSPIAVEKRISGEAAVQDRQLTVANPGRLVIPRDVLVQWASEKA